MLGPAAGEVGSGAASVNATCVGGGIADRYAETAVASQIGCGRIDVSIPIDGNQFALGTDVDVTQALPNLQGAEYRAATVELVDRAIPTRPIDQAVCVDRDPPNVRPSTDHRSG